MVHATAPMIRTPPQPCIDPLPTTLQGSRLAPSGLCPTGCPPPRGALHSHRWQAGCGSGALEAVSHGPDQPQNREGEGRAHVATCVTCPTDPLTVWFIRADPTTGSSRSEPSLWIDADVCSYPSVLSSLPPQRLGFAVVELFAVSSESLKRMDKTAADQHSAALAQVASLQAQLAASQAARQEQEQSAALEWRRMRQEVRHGVLATGGV